MFTLRFMSFFEEKEGVSTVISAPHYEVYTHRNGRKVVTVYKDFTTLDGIERTVMSDELAKELAAKANLGPLPDYYHVCYVENSAGKTIDKIRTK